MADLLSAFEQQTYSSSSRRAGGAVPEPSSLNPFEVPNPVRASFEPVSSQLLLVLADIVRDSLHVGTNRAQTAGVPYTAPSGRH